MRMVITCYLLATNSAGNHPACTKLPLLSCVYRESGWQSVYDFQRDRILHYMGHPTEVAYPIERGVKVVERFGNYGFKRVQECRLYKEGETWLEDAHHREDRA